jgi:indole-3-glycerol phosphate synthase
MVPILATIADHVRGVIELRRREMPLDALRDRPLFHSPTRSFSRSLRGKQRRIIAEVKKASPSKGLIRAEFDPLFIANDYAVHGACAISVLTEEHFFQGSLGDLEKIREAVNVPLLRKDFTLDPYQIVEAKSYGADAVLLIAALLDSHLMDDLRAQASALGLDSMVEVHTETELDSALRANAQVIGVNNRDLKTFAVDLSTTERLAPLIPSGLPAVCESGIDSLDQIRRVEKCGVHVFLIGEALMRSPEPGRKLAELLKN